MASEFVLQEISAELRETLARFATAGEVVVTAEEAILSGHGPQVRVPVGRLVEQWDELQLPERQRRCQELARQLAAARRSSLAPTKSAPRKDDAPPSARVVKLPGFLAPLVAILVVAGVAYGAYVYFFPSDSDGASASASASAPPEENRDQRARRVCEATRSRVMRGATVTGVDVEGWVVDLVLIHSNAGAPLSKAAELAPFMSPGPNRRIIWPQTKELSAIERSDTQARLVDDMLGENRVLTVSFEGLYVTSYFRESQRNQFVVLANGLANALGADHGGLYARCAHSHNHHIGTWFLGPDPGGASTSLIYFMGTFADSPHLRANLLRPDGGAIDRGHAFEQLLQSTDLLDRERVATLIGTQGGMITGKEDGRTTLRFPYRDSNRASRVSRLMARELAIGVNR